MNDDEIIATALKPPDALRQHGGATYSKFFDQRKRRVRGLWDRKGACYAEPLLNVSLMASVIFWAPWCHSEPIGVVTLTIVRDNTSTISFE